MNRALWTEVDRYVGERLGTSDEALESALKASDDAGLPAINVAPNQGKLLHLLATLQGAGRILEIGTLGGYSTIWLARALPDGGKLVTIEADPHHAEVARANLAHAGLADVVDIRTGAALDLLPQLEAERADPFDLTFIDADKQNTAEYFAWALKLSRVGSAIVVDNVVRSGAVANLESTDPLVRGVQRFVDAAAAETRVSATVLQTVGSKGYDGLAIAVITG